MINSNEVINILIAEDDNDDFYVLKSRIFYKNLKIKVNNKDEVFEENISVLNLLVFQAVFCIIFVFSLCFILLPRNNFFQNSFSFVSAFGILLLITYFVYC